MFRLDLTLDEANALRALLTSWCRGQTELLSQEGIKTLPIETKLKMIDEIEVMARVVEKIEGKNQEQKQEQI